MDFLSPSFLLAAGGLFAQTVALLAVMNYRTNKQAEDHKEFKAQHALDIKSLHDTIKAQVSNARTEATGVKEDVEQAMADIVKLDKAVVALAKDVEYAGRTFTEAASRTHAALMDMRVAQGAS